MSRKPNETTPRKTGANQAGSKKPKAGQGKKGGFQVEETPITISGGSINVDSKLDRKAGTFGRGHKKCKISDADPSNKWTLVRMEEYAAGQGPGTHRPLQSYPIGNPANSVVVIFQRNILQGPKRDQG